jgi:hypothetical protein
MNLKFWSKFRSTKIEINIFVEHQVGHLGSQKFIPGRHNVVAQQTLLSSINVLTLNSSLFINKRKKNSQMLLKRW